jgi:hypothetical protein
MTDGVLRWLLMAGLAAYAVVMFAVVRSVASRYVPGRFRKPLLYGLGFGVPLLGVLFRPPMDVLEVMTITALAAIFAILTAPEPHSTPRT